LFRESPFSYYIPVWSVERRRRSTRLGSAPIEMDGVGGGGGIRTTVRHFRREAAADKMHTDPSNIYGDSLSLSPISAMYSMFLI
jgi:hypothetical protein